jgi:uncharacterized protein
MAYETVVGRGKENLEKFGDEAAGYIGKHIVGTGEDAHLTTRVLFDFINPHMVLITGKRGSGKSYDGAILAEEMLKLPDRFRKNLAAVFIDTMGIFWSLKNANDQQSPLLAQWGLEPSAFSDVVVLVPYAQKDEFEKGGVKVDGGLTIAPSEFSADEWRLAFNLSPTEPAGIALEKAVNMLISRGDDFLLDDMVDAVRDDRDVADEVKKALVNMLSVASGWGVFGKEGTRIDDIVVPGKVTVVDISRLRATEAWSVRNFIVAVIARKIYQRRVVARKGEELAKVRHDVEEEYRPTFLTIPKRFQGDMESEEAAVKREKFPMVWLIVDEAHNFAPSDHDTVSTEPLTTIAKQGREPGVSLAVITQMPNKVHQDVLSQCDIVISHRLTSKSDLEALHSVMQTYMEKDLWNYINNLPRWPGAAIILDDNLEKVFTVQMRPRVSHHAGGTAAVV